MSKDRKNQETETLLTYPSEKIDHQRVELLSAFDIADMATTVEHFHLGKVM